MQPTSVISFLLVCVIIWFTFGSGIGDGSDLFTRRSNKTEKSTCRCLNEHGVQDPDLMRGVVTLMNMLLEESVTSRLLACGRKLCPSVHHQFRLDEKAFSGTSLRTGSCYLLIREVSSWGSAKQICKHLNYKHTLVSIESRAEQEYIRKNYSDSPGVSELSPFCTSGVGTGQGKFVWEATGETISFTNWDNVSSVGRQMKMGVIAMDRYSFKWFATWPAYLCIPICEMKVHFDEQSCLS